MGDLLTALGRLRGLPPPAPLASLREGASPVAKLYNWNLLAPALRPFDIEVDTDTKARIVAGDLDVVAGLLCRFYERVVGQDSGAGGDDGAPARQQPAEQHQEPGPAPPRASMLTEPGDGIADRAMFEEIQGGGASSVEPTPRGTPGAFAQQQTRFAPAAKTQPAGARTPGAAIEFLAESLAYAEAMGVDADEAHLVVGGAPHELCGWLIEGKPAGDFSAVSAWLRALLARGAEFADALDADTPEARAAMLTALSAGLRSRSKTMVGMSMRVLSAVARQLNHSTAGARAAEIYEWFVGDEGALAPLLGAWQTHAGDEVVAASIAVIDRFARRSLVHFFEHALVAHVPEPRAQLEAARRMLPHVAAHASMRRAFADGGVPAMLAQRASTYADGAAPGALKVEAALLSTRLWALFPAELESRAESCQAVLALLKRGCRDAADQTVVEASHQCLVELLEAFTIDGNAFVPVVFNAMVFSLVENWHNVGVRRLLDEQVAKLFRAQQGLAVGALVEPMCKHAMLHDGAQGGTLQAGIRPVLLDALAAHGRLEPKHAAMLAPLLARSALQTDADAQAAGPTAGGAYGNRALWPLVAMARRFERSPDVQSQLVAFVETCIRTFHEPLGVPGSAQRQAAALDALESLVGVGSPSLCAKMEPLLARACSDWAHLNDTPHPRLQELLAAIDQVPTGPLLPENDAKMLDHDADATDGKERVSPVSTLQAEASAGSTHADGVAPSEQPAQGFDKAAMLAAMGWTEDQWTAAMSAAEGAGAVPPPAPRGSRGTQQPREPAVPRTGESAPRPALKQRSLSKQPTLASTHSHPASREPHGDVADAGGSTTLAQRRRAARREEETRAAAEQEALEQKREALRRRARNKEDYRRQEMKRKLLARRREEIELAKEKRLAKIKAAKEAKEAEERKNARIRKRLSRSVSSDGVNARRQIFFSGGSGQASSSHVTPGKRGHLATPRSDQLAGARGRRTGRASQGDATDLPPGFVRVLVAEEKPTLVAAVAYVAEVDAAHAPVLPEGLSDDDAQVELALDALLADDFILGGEHVLPMAARKDEPADVEADIALLNVMLRKDPAAGVPAGFIKRTEVEGINASKAVLNEMNMRLASDANTVLPMGYVAVAGAPIPAQYEARLAPTGDLPPDGIPDAPLSAPTPTRGSRASLRGAPKPGDRSRRRSVKGAAGARGRERQQPGAGRFDLSRTAPGRASTAPGRGRGALPRLDGTKTAVALSMKFTDAKAKAFISEYVDSILRTLVHRASGAAVNAAAATVASPPKAPAAVASPLKISIDNVAEPAGVSAQSPKVAMRQADARIRRAKRLAAADMELQKRSFMEERRKQQEHTNELRKKVARDRQERRQRQKAAEQQKEKQSQADAKERARLAKAASEKRAAQRARVAEYRRKKAAADAAKLEEEQRRKAEKKKKEMDALERRRLKLHKKLIAAGVTPLSIIEGKDDLTPLQAIDNERAAAATKIQAVVRGRQDRTKVAKSMSAKTEKDEATTIDDMLDALLSEVCAEAK